MSLQEFDLRYKKAAARAREVAPIYLRQLAVARTLATETIDQDTWRLAEGLYDGWLEFSERLETMIDENGWQRKPDCSCPYCTMMQQGEATKQAAINAFYAGI